MAAGVEHTGLGLHCGTAFQYHVRSGPRPRYCSEPCSRQHTYQHRKARLSGQCAACKSPSPPGKKYCSKVCRLNAWRVQLTCQHCGTVFAVKPCHKHRRFCSGTCQRAHTAAQAVNRRTCLACGETYRKRTADLGLFCSRRCYETSAEGRLLRASRARTVARHYRRHLRRGAHRIHKQRAIVLLGPLWVAPPKPPRALACVDCGTGLGNKWQARGRDRRYCDSCKGKRRYATERASRHKRGGNRWRSRARKLGVAYEPIDPTLVFERDGWRCQICGKRTPKRNRGTRKPNAPELDHRIPLTRSGAHLYTNVQCACRKCNGEKGNRRETGQLPLYRTG